MSLRLRAPGVLMPQCDCLGDRTRGLRGLQRGRHRRGLTQDWQTHFNDRILGICWHLSATAESPKVSGVSGEFQFQFILLSTNKSFWEGG